MSHVTQVTAFKGKGWEQATICNTIFTSPGQTEHAGRKLGEVTRPNLCDLSCTLSVLGL